jgi:serine/threonine protein kinase
MESAMLDYSTLQSIELLKTCSLGVLEKGTFYTDSVAVKHVSFTDLSFEQRETIRKEIEHLKQIEHPRILKYHGYIWSNRFGFVMELMNSSLVEVVTHQSKFSACEIITVAKDIAEGLKYIHEMNIQFKLRPTKILINSQRRAKIGIVGFTKSDSDKTTEAFNVKVFATVLWTLITWKLPTLRFQMLKLVGPHYGLEKLMMSCRSAQLTFEQIHAELEALLRGLDPIQNDETLDLGTQSSTLTDSSQGTIVVVQGIGSESRLTTNEIFSQQRVLPKSPNSLPRNISDNSGFEFRRAGQERSQSMGPNILAPQELESLFDIPRKKSKQEATDRIKFQQRLIALASFLIFLIIAIVLILYFTLRGDQQNARFL